MELRNHLDFLLWQQYLEIVRYCSGSSPSSASGFQSSAEWEKRALSPCSMGCLKAWSPLFNIYMELLGQVIRQHGVSHLQLWLDYWGGYLWLLTGQHTLEKSWQFGIPVDLLLQPTKQVVAMVKRLLQRFVLGTNRIHSWTRRSCLQSLMSLSLPCWSIDTLALKATQKLQLVQSEVAHATLYIPRFAHYRLPLHCAGCTKFPGFFSGVIQDDSYHL